MSVSRLVAPLAVSASLLCGCLLIAEPAGASTHVFLDLKDSVQATTTLATLNQTVTLSTGSFVGTVNTKGKVKGHLSIPDTTAPVKLAGVGLADVTVGFAPTRPITGSLNIGSMKIKATSTQYILVQRVAPLGLPVNLVGNSCSTSVPVVIKFIGQIAPTGVVSVSGTYTIPSFVHCQGIAEALDLAVSGSGNSFRATLTPASG
jgi:hypothetical protein